MELVQENAELKARTQGLEDQLRIRTQLVVRDDCYWLPRDGQELDGPFCTNCWDVRKDLVRMWRSGNPEYSSCPNCKRAITVRRRD